MPTYWDAFIEEMNKQNIKLSKLHIATVLELFFYYCNNRPEKYNSMLVELHTTANVRFGWITRLSQIMLRITSYIRKRCRK